MTFRSNFLLTLVSLSIALLSAELALRIIRPAHHAPDTPKTNWAVVPERIWTQYDPVLGWRHQKNKTAESIKEGSFKVRVHTNSAGMRGQREYTEDKPEGMIRLVILGDSFPFGFGVEDSETFPSTLEHRFPQLEVLNLAVAGYGLDQMLLMYQTNGQRYHPDYVLIGVYFEDFWRSTRSFADSGHAKPYFVLNAKRQLELRNFPVPAPYSLTTNQFPEVVQNSSFEKWLLQSHLYALFKRALIKIGKLMGWVSPDTTIEFILGSTLIEQLIQDIKTSGAQPMVMVIPPDRWVMDQATASLLTALRSFLAKKQIPIIDMTDVIKKNMKQGRPITDFYIRKDGHWTPAAHQLAAREVGAFLKKWLPFNFIETDENSYAQ